MNRVDDEPTTFYPNPCRARRRQKSWRWVRWTTTAVAVVLLTALGTFWLVTRRPAEPPLSPLQKVVRRRILDDANQPENVRFERWYPEVEEPMGRSWPQRRAGGPWGDLGVKLGLGGGSILCDHVVRVVYRTTGGLGWEFRWDRLFYIDHGRIMAQRERRDDPYYQEHVDHYYPDADRE